VKGVIPRELANRDVEEAIDHYLVEATAKVALGFVDELEKAYAHIARHPASGSPRYAHQLGLADLRFWPLGRYPHLIFYVECDEHIDVWRVLHEQRDIPSWMNEP
jgi:toxin ParE1/3/4